MKTLLASVVGLVLAVASFPTFAHGEHNFRGPYVQHRYHHLYGHRPVVVYRDNWVGPLVGGVILGAVIADANAKEKEKETQVIIQQPNTVTIVCTEWKEIMTSDGKVYKERSCKEEK